MKTGSAEPGPIAGRSVHTIEHWRDGVLAPFLAEGSVAEVPAVGWTADRESCRVVFSAHRLQDVADYRAALQSWFAAVEVGGYLVIVVPHAFIHERRIELPTPLNPGQRRLYTPGVLMEQVEEALAPNSYRVRLLRDDDDGYDYAASLPGVSPGNSDVVLVLERIAPPAWGLDIPFVVQATAPDYGFEPARTRVEMQVSRVLRKILVLKLDHMGDFIMGLPALQRARAAFAGAEITLVVGHWNVQIAEASGVADRVIGFDAFPRNSTEEEVDVPGQAALFARTVTDDYDLAIDLRTDLDTRFLLRKVRAGLRAGIGTRARFPFLDIFLPVDWNRNEPETAREYKLNNHDFVSQGPVVRGDYRSISTAATAEHFCAIIWGPYWRLRPGRYYFEPWIELDPHGDGQLLVDVSLSARRVVHQLIPPAKDLRLSFTVDNPDDEFEFHIWTVADAPSIDFSFFGGRLIREGANSVLHQSEYLSLLIDLIELRLRRTGLLTSVDELS